MAEYVLFMMFLGVLGTIVLILWICLPFAVFGTKPRLDEMIRELRKINAQLAAIAERGAPRP